MSRVSARPESLRHFTGCAEDAGARLHRRAGWLAEDLNAFRASEGWRKFLSDVPPLDVDVLGLAEGTEALGAFTAVVAAAFERADSSVGAGGLAMADEHAIERGLAPLPPIALYDLRNPDAWEAALTSLGYDPARVIVFFRDLEPRTRNLLAQRHPEIIGALDGAPPGMRDTANRILIDRDIDRLRQKIEDIDRVDQRWPGSPAAFFRDRDWLAGRLETLERLRDDHRVQVLVYDAQGDSQGDGRIALAMGDLEHATHRAVIIPGVGNDLDNFDTLATPFMRNLHAEQRARALEAGQDPNSVATVIWMDYDPPDTVVGGISPRRAQKAGQPLALFMQGIEYRDNAHTTLIGHSYGSRVAGEAAKVSWHADPGDKQDVIDDFVALGSPGTGVDHAAQLGLGDDGKVWVSKTEGDPIRLANVAGPLSPHDRDPTQPEFGARNMDPGEDLDRLRGADAHGSYFDRGSRSLRNLAYISTENDGRVVLREP